MQTLGSTSELLAALPRIVPFSPRLSRGRYLPVNVSGLRSSVREPTQQRRSDFRGNRKVDSEKGYRIDARPVRHPRGYDPSKSGLVTYLVSYSVTLNDSRHSYLCNPHAKRSDIFEYYLVGGITHAEHRKLSNPRSDGCHHERCRGFFQFEHPRGPDGYWSVRPLCL